MYVRTDYGVSIHLDKVSEKKTQKQFDDKKDQMIYNDMNVLKATDR